MRSNRVSLPWIAAALLAVLLAPAASAEQKVQIVFDASGSMWGQIEGQTKIEIAREAMKQMLDGWDEGVDIGLTAYGHRRKGDCNDIETLIAPAPPDPAAFGSAVDGLVPKGKTPLSEAVRRAAEDLKYTEEKAAVVLISDGLETCGADPCAAAKALDEKGVDFKVHVVGFDLKEGESEQLECIARATGGNFWLAKDAAGLTDAFTEVVEVVAAPPAPEPETELQTEPAARSEAAAEAVAVVDSEPEKAAEPRPAPGATIETEVVTEATSKTARTPRKHQGEFRGVKLVPFMSEGGEVIGKDVHWKILAPEPDFEGKRRQFAAKDWTGTHIFELEPGRYLVRGTYGFVSVEQVIEVETGQGEIFDIVFDAAKLKVTAVMAPGSEALSNVHWKLLAPEVDFEGRRKQFAGKDWAGPGHVMTVPAGHYRIQAAHDFVTRTGEVTLTPGEKKTFTMDMQAARVSLSAVLAAGQEPLANVHWKVLAPEVDFEGRRAQFAAKDWARPGHRMTIPAGTYQLQVTHGFITRTADLTVAPGERKVVTVDLAGAQVALSAVLAAGGEPVNQVHWKVFRPDADGTRVPVASKDWANPGYLMALPAGSYEVEVRHGNVSATGTLELEAGARVRHTVDLSANDKLATR
jgi:Ca-activated chloride channel family protein